MFLFSVLGLLAFFTPTLFAATADQWRGRSIYQIITDRYALPDGTVCDPAGQTFCGGSWKNIQNNLDYIQNAGFTAVWISPVAKNYDGARTPYGDAYHGYWMSDISQLNPRFGTADDLKALSAELHKRNMYLMVDVVVNNVMSTTITPDYSQYFFKDKSFYHPYCPIVWGNITSEKNCWLGDTKVPLPDVDTTNPTVISRYQEWIKELVAEYSIDGLRIDAAKHTQTDFWPQFCGAAGVFCMGEVFGSDLNEAASYQGAGAMDSILNYPMYGALVDAFAIPGKQNVSSLVDVLQTSNEKFTDVSLLGNFIENQDLPRWHNISVDPQSMYNAMSFNFMSSGIPVVYYGQEQGFSGFADPLNREPLWTTNGASTPAYSLLANLNQFRNWLVNNNESDWLTSTTEVLTNSPFGVAIQKGSVISVLTNIGSPPKNDTAIVVYTPWAPITAATEILSCKQWQVASGGVLSVQYNKGGVPSIFIPTDLLVNSGLCGNPMQKIATQQSSNNAASSRSSIFIISTIMLVIGSVQMQ